MREDRGEKMEEDQMEAWGQGAGRGDFIYGRKRLQLLQFLCRGPGTRRDDDEETRCVCVAAGSLGPS